YRPIIGGWIGHLGFEGGYIRGIGQRVRINDRFFLGNPRFRGFDVAGVGPIDLNTGQFLGGNTFFVATAGFVIPLGEFAEELGFQVSAYVDVGTLFNAQVPLFDINGNLIQVFFNNPDGSVCDPAIDECVRIVQDTGSLRMSVGIGITWDSPFGPVRLDIARVILQEDTDRTESISFNVGTRF
ncbi:MAG: BamA/TamA family outer membrane protein, partial [Sphingomonadales bacterium]